MAGVVQEVPLRTYTYYDTVNSGQNAIAGYQVMSALTAAQLSTFSATAGNGARPADPTGVTLLDKIVGISEYSVLHGGQIAVRPKGVCFVMTDGTATYGSIQGPTLVEQRTNAQTPLINLTELLLPMDQRFTVTYNLSMCGNVTPAHPTGTVLANLPTVGFALETGDTKYQIIKVDVTGEVVIQ